MPLINEVRDNVSFDAGSDMPKLVIQKSDPALASRRLKKQYILIGVLFAALIPLFLSLESRDTQLKKPTYYPHYGPNGEIINNSKYGH